MGIGGCGPARRGQRGIGVLVSADDSALVVQAVRDRARGAWEVHPLQKALDALGQQEPAGTAQGEVVRVRVSRYLIAVC